MKRGLQRRLGLCLILGFTHTSFARSGSPYELNWSSAATVLAGTTAAALGARWLQRRQSVPICECNPELLNPLDRHFLGPRDLDAERMSDRLLRGAPLAALAINAVSISSQGFTWSGYTTDVVVMTQAILINDVLTQSVKLLVRRPRPRLYLAGASAADGREPDHQLSFLSGHTSSTFAGAMSLARTLELRHGRSVSPATFYGSATALGLFVGWLRMEAGLHFSTDVLVGAVVGTAIGIVVPNFYRRQSASLGESAASHLTSPVLQHTWVF